jgi:type II secretory pathway predicted ATPase ExeA
MNGVYDECHHCQARGGSGSNHPDGEGFDVHNFSCFPVTVLQETDTLRPSTGQQRADQRQRPGGEANAVPGDSRGRVILRSRHQGSFRFRERRTWIKFSTVEFLEHWRLRERPFEPTWDARFYFQGREHDEALNRLGFVVSEQTMLLGLLTGEIGCGKTLTRAVLADRLDRRHFCVVTHENSSFSFNDLLGMTLTKLSGDETKPARTKATRWCQFERRIEELQAAQNHLVLIFDEAQEMSAATLNELKQLTNLNGHGRGALTVLLVGQPELRDQVARLPALDQRISLRFHLPPLSLAETAQYFGHRLRTAGHPSGDLFNPEAVEQAFAATGGIPRALNRVAKLALEFAWVQEYPEVTCAAVDAVVRDRNSHQTLAIA